ALTIAILQVLLLYCCASLAFATRVDMGITPHSPPQNRTCAINAYGFSPYKAHSPFLRLLSQTSTILWLCRTSCHSFEFLTHFFVLVSIPLLEEMAGSQLFR